MAVASDGGVGVAGARSHVERAASAFLDLVRI